jgi:predicted SnoaL-like aldol condensation-catalyzing enzyme
VFAENTPAEVSNKQVVLDFYAALNAADASGTTAQRIADIAAKYIDPGYVQHGEAFANLPGPGSARDRLVSMFQHMPPMPPRAAPQTLTIMAQDDLVSLVTIREMPDPATGKLKQLTIFNLFRLKNGHLVEHWDSLPPMGPGGPGAPPPAVDTAPASK